MAIDFQTNIEHIVVLVLENRSFDHMCGYFGRGNGVSGGLSNPENPADPASPTVAVSDDAAYVGDLVDPAHDLLSVNVQLFGTAAPGPAAVPTNDGFVLNYASQPGITMAKARSIMKCFAPAKLPVLRTLAENFVLCDNWFASVPGPTWSNRFFLHAATSGGTADNNLRDYEFPTIYDHLSDAGYDWGIYFHDLPQSLTIASLRQARYRDKFKPFPKFFLELKTGNLPAYSFIEPRYFDFLRWRANDQHPPHDVRLGEHLIADIYDALRKSSVWDSTLFFVLYDEHGGIYDHVHPGTAVSPDGAISVHPPFTFERMGIRVPAIVVSPLVGKGVVDSNMYDHTSLLATVQELFNLPKPLTHRDRDASTVSGNLSANLRKDPPMKLPRPVGEPTTDAFRSDETNADMTSQNVTQDLATGQASTAPLSEFQKSLVDTANTLPDATGRLDILKSSRLIQTEHDAAVHVRDVAARFLKLQ